MSQRGGVHPSLLVLVWLLLHPRGRRGVLVDRGRGHICIGSHDPCFPRAGSFWMWSGHHSLLSVDLFVRNCEGSWGLPSTSLDL